VIHYRTLLLVVSSTNACAKPQAVMIEPQNTVIASITVCRAWWPENFACFTEFHFIHGRPLLSHLPI